MPHWITRRTREWRKWWPLVLRSTCQQGAERARQAGRAEVQDNVTSERKMLVQIIDRLCRVEYRRVDRQYQMTVYFNPSMFTYGDVGRDEQRYLAAYIARQVEAEIASSKFVKDANEREAREGPPYPNFQNTAARYVP